MNEELKPELQITGPEVVLGLEVVLGILASVASFGVFPGWVVILIPILMKELPVAEVLFANLWKMLAAAHQANVPPSTVITALNAGVDHAHEQCKKQWQDANPNKAWPWT